MGSTMGEWLPKKIQKIVEPGFGEKRNVESILRPLIVSKGGKKIKKREHPAVQKEVWAKTWFPRIPTYGGKKKSLL